MASDDLARRFLHVNLNCASLDATERLYGRLLGLNVRMRTDPSVPTDGSILGLSGETFCETSFLYDARGGRAGCALEAIEYRSPALGLDESADPVRPGIRSTLLTVADLEATSQSLRSEGITVGPRVQGLISAAPSVLAIDSDGAVIELTEAAPGVEAANGVLFSGIRIAAIDIGASTDFLNGLGFIEVTPATSTPVFGTQLSPNGSAEPTDCLVARFALAEDAHQFSVVVVQHPKTPADPVPWGGNHQGLYRCALRVESVTKALDAVPSYIEKRGEPVWCPLPGTKIDGLYIAFLRSPDGVVFEFVERPLSFFSR